MLQTGNLLELSCDDPDEREEWIETLNMVITYLRRLATASEHVVDGYDPKYEDDEECYEKGEEIGQNCNAFGPGLFGSEAGKKSQFMIQMHDIQGQEVLTGGMPITATISNDECLYYLKIKDNDDGTYSAHYVLSKPGIYQLGVRINDEHDIYGSPFELEILPSKTIAETTTAEGETLLRVSPKEISKFKIHAADAFGNPKTRGGDNFEVSLMGPAELKSLADNSDGSYTASFVASDPSTVSYLSSASLNILVTLNGKHIVGSPFKPNIIIPTPSPTPNNIISRKTKSNSISAIKSPNRPVNTVSKTNKEATNIPVVKYPSPQIPPKHLSPEPIKPPPVQIKEESSSNFFNHSYNNNNNNKSRSIDNYISSENNNNQSSSSVNGGGASVASNNGGSLSRLERARQRAIMAKKMTEGGQSNEVESPELQFNSSELDLSAYGLNSNNQVNEISSKLSKLDSLSKTVGVATPGSKLSNFGNSKSTSKLAAVANTAAAFHIGPIGTFPFNANAVIRDLQMGMIGLEPPTLSAEERNMWEQTNIALDNNDVISLLASSLTDIKLPYDCLSEVVDGVQILKLTNQQLGGTFRLLEEYDIIPPYMSKKDAKAAFMLILCSQRNSTSLASNVAGGSGLDFPNFIKLMVLIAVVSLSKTSSFSSMYESFVARIDVMLNKWGIADGNKLQLVKRNLRQTK
jgi:hypothetical protein